MQPEKSTTERPGFVRAERAFITLTLNTLRGTPRTRCFFCGGLLEGGTCFRCAADSDGWT